MHYDAYGVLNRGADAMDGSIAAFDAARAAANKLVVLTNDASGARAAIARKHCARGFAVTAADIIAGVGILVEHLDASGRYGYLGPEPRPHHQHTQQMPDLSQLTRNFDSLDGFVLLEHPRWDEQLQQRYSGHFATQATLDVHRQSRYHCTTRELVQH